MRSWLPTQIQKRLKTLFPALNFDCLLQAIFSTDSSLPWNNFFFLFGQPQETAALMSSEQQQSGTKLGHNELVMGTLWEPWEGGWQQSGARGASLKEAAHCPGRERGSSQLAGVLACLPYPQCSSAAVNVHSVTLGTAPVFLFLHSLTPSGNSLGWGMFPCTTCVGLEIFPHVSNTFLRKKISRRPKLVLQIGSSLEDMA